MAAGENIMPPNQSTSPVEAFAADRSQFDVEPTRSERLVRHLEELSETITTFVSGHWGTLTAFLAVACGAVIFLHGASSLSTFAEQIMTMLSLALLFLLQRSQTKATLSVQVKLNELLR